MQKYFLGFIAFILASAAFAQGNGELSRAPIGGNVTVTLTPTLHPSTLLDLVRHSQLIVDATVATILPAISTDPTNQGPHIETHSILTLNEVLKGTVPGASASILLAQVGGSLGAWNVVAKDDPLVATGERYVLFLVPDDRKDLPSYSGIPRYAAIGISLGKVKVTNGNVQLAPSAGNDFSSHNGQTLAAFLQDVRQTIIHPYTNSSLPIFPLPPGSATTLK